MRSSTKSLMTSILFFIAFGIFTYFVQSYDVQPAGPDGSPVGFATVNLSIFKFLGGGINPFWYNFSQRLGYVAIAVMCFFAIKGFLQFVKGKSLKKVDPRIIALGVFYLLLFAVYVLFNKLAVNMRPVLEADGSLEASYPSSHTALALCVFCTMFKQKIFNRRKSTSDAVKNTFAATVLVCFMIISRILANVHWITDICGGILISIALISLYDFALYRMLKD